MIQEDWSKRKWRSYMAMLYMIICSFDFLVFPILWSILQAYKHGEVTQAWSPLTLQGGGLFHMSFGAILGVTAWTRGQEKITQIRENKKIPHTEDDEL